MRDNQDNPIVKDSSIADSQESKQSAQKIENTNQLQNCSNSQVESFSLHQPESNSCFVAQEEEKITRRSFVVLAASAVACVGVVASLFPFIKSLAPDKAVLAVGSTEVDLAKIAEGQSTTVMWRGQPIFVRHRTEAEIAAAQNVQMHELKDPQEDAARVKKGYEKWLVTVGVCTHLGCVPLSNKGEFDGWFCPCHGSEYDTSGRIRKGPAPLNLPVPPYEFINDNMIKIG